MDKIQQLEKQLADISAELQKLKSEPKFEVGKWYKFKSDFCSAIVCYQGGKSGYGFSESNWKHHESWTFDVNALDWIPATESEVFEALEKEAIKRGIVVGVTIDKLNIGDSMNRDVVKITNLGLGFVFSLEENRLRFNGDTVFYKGKWAEIISEPFKICGYEVEEECSVYTIGCKKLTRANIHDLKVIMDLLNFKTVQFDEYKVTLEEVNKILNL
jgi:hypothetical protein